MAVATVHPATKMGWAVPVAVGRCSGAGSMQSSIRAAVSSEQSSGQLRNQARALLAAYGTGGMRY